MHLFDVLVVSFEIMSHTFFQEVFKLFRKTENLAESAPLVLRFY